VPWIDRRVAGAAASALGAGALAHYLPSVSVVGTFLPTPPRALPAGWCRWRLPAGIDQVAITLDDGPSPTSTPATLDLLDELGLRVTFFVLGEHVCTHEDLTAELVRRGHTVGVHGHRHEHHLLRGPRWTADDTEAAVAAVAEATGRPTRWYRPPYGQMTARTILQARRHGLEVVLWSCWGKEFADPSVPSVARRLERGTRPGAILLLHDSDAHAPVGTAARTRQVLPHLAEAIEARGLRAVTLDDALGAAAGNPHGGPRPPEPGRVADTPSDHRAEHRGEGAS
jgi:YD repeat-containing protein